MQRYDDERTAWQGRRGDTGGRDWYGGHGESWERPEDFGARGERDRAEVAGGYGRPRDPEWRRRSPGPMSQQQRGYGRHHSGPIGRWPEADADTESWQAGPNEAFHTLSGPGERGYRASGYGYGGAYRPFTDRGLFGQDEGDRARRGPYSGRGPRGYRRGDDRIREDVCEVLSQHGEIDASEIEIEVHEGEVTLTGAIEDRWQKRAAEDALDEISGVRDVHNHLRVRPRYWQEGGPVQADQLATTGTAGNETGSTSMASGATGGVSAEAGSGRMETNARSAARSR